MKWVRTMPWLGFGRSAMGTPSALSRGRRVDSFGPVRGRGVWSARTVAVPEGEAMSVYKVIEVIGTSTTSWEDAAAVAVAQARETLRDLRVAEVVKQDLDVGEDGTLTYRTKLSVSFKYQGES